MSPKQAQINFLMQEAKKKLLARRAQLLETIARRNDVVAHISSFASPTAENGERALAVSFIFPHTEQVACLEREFKAVEDALKRAENGTWGLCTGCERPIEEERLEAVPETVLCLICSGCSAVCGVMLLGAPWSSKGRTVSVLRETLDISRRRAQALLTKVPVRIVERVTEVEARAIAAELESAGALVFVFNERARAKAEEHYHDESEEVA